MDISVVVTTRNEEQTLGKLLDSLLTQTKKASEIIIVDGGSTDETTAIIENYQEQNKIIHLLKEKGTIAHGRNVGIKNARYPIIALIDAGCVAKEDWLEKLTEPFAGKKTSIVAGFYHMVGELPFQKAIAPFLGIPPERFNRKTFLSSTRSMAFKKSVWEKVGGFSEKLSRTAEDTVFNYEIVKEAIEIRRVKEAIVYWEMPRTLWESIKKFYFYARGDAEADIWFHPVQKESTHNLKIVIIFMRYLVGLMILIISIQNVWLLYILAIGFIFYLLWSIYKMRDIVKDYKAKLWIPIIQLSSDFAVMCGFIAGVIKR